MHECGLFDIIANKQMGYSSWNDCGSVVSEEHIKATAKYMIKSGLAAKG